MPGYTHLQRAVPSSVGLWLAGFAEAFIDDAALAATARWIDACPLGTAAGYGVNLPLDRQGVSDELGFSRLLVNPMYAQNSRGKLELRRSGRLLQALFDVRRFAWDLSLYTTAEFAFVKLPAEYTTGSSIMPNKKNPDVRGAPPRQPLGGARGHGRDREPALAPLGLPPRPRRPRRGPSSGRSPTGRRPSALAPGAGTADGARSRSAWRPPSPGPLRHRRRRGARGAGVPFRTAYRQVADGLGALGARKPEESLAARVSPGATADLMLGVLRERLEALRAG